MTKVALEYARPKLNRRATIIAVSLAVAVHAVILILVARARLESQDAVPPGITGLGRGTEGGVSGMPMTDERFAHTFRILDEETAQPLPGVRVTDVLGGSVSLSNREGRAQITVRPGARLVVHVEKAGYALEAAQIANTTSDGPTRTVILRRKPVDYAIIDTIFIQRCNYCHGAVGATVGINLTSYDNVVRSTAHGGPIVVPEQPDSSRLHRILADSVDVTGKPSAHYRVTRSMSAFDREWIAQWILEGARGPARRR